jgi:N-acetylglutamate synthase-like GNAT family acetyltransferase
MYREQLADHPDAIELPVAQITAGSVRVAEQDGVVVGFAVLLERSADACELDGLLVDPDRMRAGVGRRLVEDAKRIARGPGATRIDLVANPQAVAFYEAVGFIATGQAQTRFGWAPRMSLSLVARSARANALLAHAFPRDVASSQRSSATLAPAAASDEKQSQTRYALMIAMREKRSPGACPCRPGCS